MNKSLKRSGKKLRKAGWRNHVSRFKSSGLSIAEYCRRNDIASSSFNYWHKKFKGPDPSVSFVPIKLPSEPSRPKLCHPLILVLNKRFSIEVRKEFDSHVLKQLVKTLEELC